MTLLSVQNLRVSFDTEAGLVEAVRGVSFDLGRERLGIVGESGSGKTMTGRSVLRLIRPPGRIEADAMHFDGTDLMAASEAEMRALIAADKKLVRQVWSREQLISRWQQQGETFKAEWAAELPEGATVYYLNLFDTRDLVISTEHEVLREE